MAHEWAEHTPSIKSLPEHARHKKKHKRAIDGFADIAVGQTAAVKLASDLGVATNLVTALANQALTTPREMASAAYTSPRLFTAFLKAASAPGADVAGAYAGFRKLAFLGGLGAVGGGIGAATAPSGHRVEGFGRGALVGGGSGLGAGLGGAIGAGLGSGGNPNQQLAAALLGALTGGVAGGLGARKMIGKPTWEKDKEHKQANAMSPLTKGLAGGGAAALGGYGGGIAGGAAGMLSAPQGHGAEGYTRGGIMGSLGGLGAVGGGIGGGVAPPLSVCSRCQSHALRVLTSGAAASPRASAKARQRT